MQRPISFSCDSSSSWVCIGVLRPKRLTTIALTSHELIDRIASVSLSFNRFAKTAVLNSTTSNHVAVISVWEKSVLDLVPPCAEQKRTSLRRLVENVPDSFFKRSTRKACPLAPPASIVDAYEKALSASCHVMHVSWYEASCSDFKELRTLSVPSKQELENRPTPPSPRGGVLKSFSSPLPIPISTPVSCSNAVDIDAADLSSLLPFGFPSAMRMDDGQPSFNSSNSLAKSLSSPRTSSSAASVPTFCLAIGDIVHLRWIINHQEHLQDSLSYSCLAILKAYFPQTQGLLSYVFYRSLDGSRMMGLGVWQGVHDALAYLNAPDGACEERYWRSMGAKTRYEIYEVAALVE